MRTAPAPFSPRATTAKGAVPSMEGLGPLELVAEGPMATVYRARRRSDGEWVACKVLSPGRGAGARACERFLREIDVMRRLDHPRLVGLLGAGVAAGRPYLLMPYFAGGSAEDLVRERGGRLSPKEAVELLAPALEGLAFLHGRSFVHRDVKPSNLLLDGSGQGTLADFGIAKSFVEAGLSGVTSTRGTPFGTPAFLPREQVTNYRFVHPASDVWAAGATLYFLISGEAPRDMAGARTAVDGVLWGSVVPLTKRVSDVPRALAKVVDKALLQLTGDTRASHSC